MGFLKKGRAPNELPDLAMDTSANVSTAPIEAPKPISESVQPPVETKPSIEPKKEVAGEDYLEFENHKGGVNHEQIKSQISEKLEAADGSELAGFFDKVLDDVNGEIQDLGKLEDWYNNKFLPQDVVSGMRGYWEHNKSDIIIQNFGAEYKQKINEKIRALQELEGDWREIYFKLIKKEEEMKKVEKELKGTLSEFVDLCKRRNINGEKKKDQKDQKIEKK